MIDYTQICAELVGTCLPCIKLDLTFLRKVIHNNSTDQRFAYLSPVT